MHSMARNAMLQGRSLLTKEQWLTEIGVTNAVKRIELEVPKKPEDAKENKIYLVLGKPGEGKIGKLLTDQVGRKYFG